MNKILCRLFIKNYKDTKNQEVRKQYGRLSGVMGIIANLVLFIIKLFAGILLGSISIIIDSINNMADMSSSIITLLGFRFASMPEDKEHPFGHERIEYITGIIISTLIIVVGIESAKASIMKFFNPERVTFNWLILFILLVSIVVKLWQSSMYRYLGNAIESKTIEAASVDSKNDVYSTVAIVISLVIYKYTGYNLDSIIGLAISLYIIYSGVELVKETSSPLLGEVPSKSFVDKLKKSIMSYPGVIGIHDLVVHSYGPGKKFVTVHIEVDSKRDIMVSHDLIDNIEKEVSRNLGIILTAHMDPIDPDDPLMTRLLKRAKTVAENIEGISEVHDLRMVTGITHTNIIFEVVKSSDCPFNKEEIEEKFKKILKGLDEQNRYNIVINFDNTYI